MYKYIRSIKLHMLVNVSIRSGPQAFTFMIHPIRDNLYIPRDELVPLDMMRVMRQTWSENMYNLSGNYEK